MFKKSLFLFSILSLFSCNTPVDTSKTVALMYKTADKGTGDDVGFVLFTDTPKGLKVDVFLEGLPAGKHGFHVHEKPDCSPMMKDGKMQHALAAGGHYDPDKTGKHLGPDGGGHKGDLPVLTVSSDGKAETAFYLKDVKVSDFINRALMIHAGGDNYSDTPKPLGGGGDRVACGIIAVRDE